MRYVIVHYCTQSECNCQDKNGVIAYDGPSKAEADRAMQSAPSGYTARDESPAYN